MSRISFSSNGRTNRKVPVARGACAAATRKVTSARLDHRERFASRPFIDQLRVGACHSCSFAELFSVIVDKSISPVHHFLDWWSRSGATRVIDYNVKTIQEHRRLEQDGKSIDHLALHGGLAAYDHELLLANGCRLDLDHADSFEELDELFSKLRVKREELVEKTEELPLAEIEQQMRKAGLDELLNLALDDSHPEDRLLVKELASHYETERIAFQGYTSSHYEEIKQSLLMFLDKDPLIANLNVSSLGGTGHAVVLVGYDPYKDCFYYKDSASRQGFQHQDAGFFIGRIMNICRLKKIEPAPEAKATPDLPELLPAPDRRLYLRG